ncbi:MAG TPA: tetratricopeptide repeat protein [Pirellulales bacterium]|nr:tetratricopeptide repeat protein [Pirellulales bacterium]
MLRPKERIREPKAVPPSAVWDWVCAAALVLLVVVVYFPTLENGFIWDDDVHVEKNKTLTSTRGLARIWLAPRSLPQYYPLTHSTFWVEYHLWGLDPRGYHAVNLALHAAAVLLAWRLFVRLGVPGAWLAAALFAVHPVCTESVAWITERKNVLSCALALGSLFAYLRFAPFENEPPTLETGFAWGRIRYYLLALLLFVAALLSKTVTASVPAVLLVIYWWKRGRLAKGDILWLMPFFVIGIALACVTAWLELGHVGAKGEEWELTLPARSIVAGRAVWFYVEKLAWPRQLVFFYPRWTVDPAERWQYAYPGSVLAVIVLLWLARGRVGRGPLAAVLIFVGVLVPALGFFNVFPFRYSYVADHFQYHASLAMFALAAACLALIATRLAASLHWVAPVIFGGLLLALAMISHERTYVYHDLFTLYEDTIQQNPTCWVAYQNLGGALYAAGRYEEAIPSYRQAIDLRREIASEYPSVTAYQSELALGYTNLALAQRKAQRSGDALASQLEAIEIRQAIADLHPTVAEHREDLASDYVAAATFVNDLGDTSQAEKFLRKGIDLRQQVVREVPQEPRYRERLATTQTDLARLKQVHNQLDEAQTGHLVALEARQSLANEYPKNEMYQEELAWSYDNLAVVALQRGRFGDAVSQLQQAISIREGLMREHPDEGRYQEQLGTAYARLGLAEYKTGRDVEALQAHQRAAMILGRVARDNPANGEIQNQLAATYVDCAVIQRDLKAFAEAEQSLRQAVSLRRKLVDRFPTVSKYKESLAATLRLQENSQGSK